jgi:hypothetical protein
MTTRLFTQARASHTAATPPSTTTTSRRPGSQRRTGFLICRAPSTLVVCRRVPRFVAGQQSALKQGNAHTRRLPGTGTKRIMATHFKPQPRMTGCLVERTASR